MQKLIKILTLISHVALHVFAVLFGIIMVGGIILQDNSEAVTSFFGHKSSIIIDIGDEEDEEVNTEYFTSDKKSVAEMKKHTGELVEEVAAGGVTLLKNENDVLPMSEGDTVSFFSVSSVDLVFAGAGSSGTGTEGTVNLKTGVTQAGLKVNNDLWNWYNANKGSYSRGEAGNVFNASFHINDPRWAQINTTAKSDKNKTGGDVAVFVVARNGSEGKDLDYTGGYSDYSNGNYLELGPSEIDVLKNLKAQKDAGVFSGIVVLLNSAYAVQCDFVDNPAYGIDSVLWVGNFGTTGANAVGDLMAGKVNPSGRITDTFWKYNRLNPVLANFGTYDYNEKISPSNIAKGNTDKYVVYQEGIYNGYRYTETRYEDYVLGQGNAGAFNYNDTVSYPFGYGISYTEFSYGDFKFESYDQKTDKYTFSVKVTNTGDIEGKEVVQLYLQKPYSVQDGIEKAAVELVGFAKTKMLAKNEDQTLTVTVTGDYFASYDAYGEGTYVQSGGKYYLTAAKNAHDAINNILEKKATAAQKSKMTAAGNASMVYETILTEDAVKYAKSPTTGKAVENQFDNADLNRYAGKGSNYVTYVSRSNWENTVKLGTDENNARLSNHIKITVTPQMKADVQLPTIEKDDVEYPTYDAEVTYSLVDLRLDEIAYDDPLWEELLDQLSWEETVLLLSSGCRKTVALETVPKPETIDHNGANGPNRNYNVNGEINRGLAVLNNDPDKSDLPVIYPCNGLVAATFDTELIELFGKAMGEDCLWAGYNGLYGTGVNIHRSPYGGRAFEYYSEDPVLTGIIAAAEVRGIQSYGVYCYMKHCALNDMEDNREGLCVWANEQSIREIYLKPFEIAIEDGGAYNVMTGFNRMGLEWTGEQGFCNNVLRDEFGMRGFAVTDWYDDRTWYMTSYGGLLGGNDLPDGQYKENSVNDLDKYREGYGELAWAMRESAHRILYTVAHSNAMNGFSSSMRVVRITPKWMNWLNTGTTVATAAFIISVSLFVVMTFINNASLVGKVNSLFKKKGE